MSIVKLSQSVLSKYRECPQKGYYEVERRLQRRPSQIYPVALTIGSWWHALRAADALARGRRLGTLVEGGVPEEITTTNGGPKFPNTASVADIIRGASRFMETLTQMERASWDDQRSETLPQTLLRMEKGYRRRWSSTFDNDRPLAVEIPFSREIVTMDGTTYVLEGIADELYWDERLHMVVLKDHKAQAELKASTSGTDLMLSQLQVYQWGLDPVVESWGLGPIRAVSYDRARTAVPATPKITVNGTLAKTPSDFDLDTYLSFVGEGVSWGTEGEYVRSGKNAGKPKFGVYEVDQRVVQDLSTPEAQARWFDRTLTPVNRHVVDTHVVSAVLTAQQIEASREMVKQRGHTIRNFGRHCEFCPMAEICRAEMSGGPRAFFDPEDFNLRVAPPRDR